ncbi:MAG: ribosomal protein L24e family protein [Nanoarchaeota archaeon]|nr:ribosomal protein L24e family protein [Nanoarchaeota archaeon]
MAKCDFCKQKIGPGTGKKFIQKDGKILDFCSAKCERHVFKLKHKSRTTKWTDEYHKLKETGSHVIKEKAKKKTKKAKKSKRRK